MILTFIIVISSVWSLWFSVLSMHWLFSVYVVYKYVFQRMDVYAVSGVPAVYHNLCAATAISLSLEMIYCV